MIPTLPLRQNALAVELLLPPAHNSAVGVMTNAAALSAAGRRCWLDDCGHGV